MTDTHTHNEDCVMEGSVVFCSDGNLRTAHMQVRDGIDGPIVYDQPSELISDVVGEETP